MFEKTDGDRGDSIVGTWVMRMEDRAEISEGSGLYLNYKDETYMRLNADGKGSRYWFLSAKFEGPKEYEGLEATETTSSNDFDWSDKNGEFCTSNSRNYKFNGISENETEQQESSQEICFHYTISGDKLIILQKEDEQTDENTDEFYYTKYDGPIPSMPEK